MFDTKLFASQNLIVLPGEVLKRNVVDGDVLTTSVEGITQKGISTKVSGLTQFTQAKKQNKSVQ